MPGGVEWIHDGSYRHQCNLLELSRLLKNIDIILGTDRYAGLLLGPADSFGGRSK